MDLDMKNNKIVIEENKIVIEEFKDLDFMRETRDKARPAC